MVCSVGGLVLVGVRRLDGLSTRAFDRALVGVFAASRFGVYGLLFLVLQIAPRGDIPGYYLVQAEEVLHGQLVYRDFISSYAPLHPYLDAAAVRVWHSSLAIILLTIVFEVISVPLWIRIGRGFLAERTLRVAALLYLASPISLLFVAIDGQDNVAVAAFFALALVLLMRSRRVLAGVFAGLPIALFKFLPLVFVPALFFTEKRRWRFVAGGLAVLVPVYGGFALLHAPLLTPLTSEGGERTSSNLIYVVEALTGIPISRGPADGLLIVVLLGIYVVIARAARGSRERVRLSAACFGLAAITVAVVVFSKKSWPPYLMLAQFPICMVGARLARRRIALVAFSAWSLNCVIATSIWSSLLGSLSSAELRADVLAGVRLPVGFLCLEVLLVAGYFWLLWGALRFIGKNENQVPAARGAVT